MNANVSFQQSQSHMRDFLGVAPCSLYVVYLRTPHPLLTVVATN
ncbi:hypothetical protein glysoja_045389 [Glycine soja]|uniref:Uncharacterized protein n=1 Tax=Glycine soja TaxID=3848 RepID=A0A0B2QRL1_GLYSO|nr:hypothetical protein glysoja_045389 [Glycine soja]